MASWVLIGFLNISWRHLHDRTFVHSLVLPPALKFYPPPDRNFFLHQIATFAEGKFKCICRAVVSDFFSAILLDIPAEQFWWNIDLIVVKSLLLWPWVTLFLWDEVEIVFNMSVCSTSTVALLSFSVTSLLQNTHFHCTLHIRHATFPPDHTFHPFHSSHILQSPRKEMHRNCECMWKFSVHFLLIVKAVNCYLGWIIQSN